jgi:hypothetical protein
MTLVQQARLSFVDVAILRFLLLGFMKAFQDGPCGCRKLNPAILVMRALA